MMIWLVLKIYSGLTFDPSLTLKAILDEETPVWTKLILPSSRSLRENM